MTNSQSFDVNGLLQAIAKKVWKKDNLSGDALKPTLDDIQEMAIATPELQKNNILHTDGYSYRVIVSENIHHTQVDTKTREQFESQGIHIGENTIFTTSHIYRTRTPTPEVETQHPLFQKDVPTSILPKKDMGMFLGMIARHIIRTPGEPSQHQAQWLHQTWLTERQDIDCEIDHPLMEVVHAWIKVQTATRITPEHNRKYPISVLKHPVGSVRGITFGERDAGLVFQTPERVDQVQLELNLGNQKSVLPAIMPLQAVQTSDLKTQTKNGALSHEIRIFFEAMMALRPSQRRDDLIFRLGDLIEYLYPNGNFNWTNQMQYIQRALAVLHNSATIPWIDDQGSLRQWRPVSVRAPIPSDATRDTPVFLDVVMPPDSKRGHMVIKNIHRRVGMKSAARWNAYHVACFLWDKYGTVKGKLVDPTRPVENRDAQNCLVDATGKPLVTRNGKEIKSPYHKEAIPQLEREPNPDTIKRYPILSTEDLIRACYPNGYPKNNRRKYLSDAKKHWEALEAAGYILIHKERTGWRILPPEEHLNAHRALRKAAKGVY